MFWIAGGVADHDARLALWAVAIAIEYVSPAVGFFVPGLGRSETTDWDVEGSHLAERCGLFIIIALGESILVTGATFARLDWTPVNASAFVVALIGSIATWWIYFNIGAERGSRHIAKPGIRVEWRALLIPISIFCSWAASFSPLWAMSLCWCSHSVLSR